MNPMPDAPPSAILAMRIDNAGPASTLLVISQYPDTHWGPSSIQLPAMAHDTTRVLIHRIPSQAILAWLRRAALTYRVSFQLG